MENHKGLGKELPWEIQEKISGLERTATSKCPYVMKENSCFYWCGTPLEKDVYPNQDPIQVTDESIKIMLHTSFHSLKHYCFDNFWDCIDYPNN